MNTMKFEIDYRHEHGGWINCWLTVDEQRHPIQASYAFPPFLDMMHFVKAVAGLRLPNQFWWDEEGNVYQFEAWPGTSDASRVHFTIKGPEDIPLVNAEVEPQVIVETFLPPLQDFATHGKGFQLAKWGFYGPIVENINHDIMQGIPRRGDPYAHQPVTIFTKVDRPNEKSQLLCMEIRLDGRRVMSWYHPDPIPFWSGLIPFLEKIAKDNLPAEWVYTQPAEPQKENTNELQEIIETQYPFITSLKADPIERTANFRLRIFSRRGAEIDYLHLDETVNRRLFVDSFVKSFEKLLKKYKPIITETGHDFDLRTLSLRNLKNK